MSKGVANSNKLIPSYGSDWLSVQNADKTLLFRIRVLQLHPPFCWRAFERIAGIFLEASVDIIDVVEKVESDSTFVPSLLGRQNRALLLRLRWPHIQWRPRLQLRPGHPRMRRLKRRGPLPQRRPGSTAEQRSGRILCSAYREPALIVADQHWSAWSAGQTVASTALSDALGKRGKASCLAEPEDDEAGLARQL